jgi:ABC-type multidrug transport system ATPase subunit
VVRIFSFLVTFDHYLIKLYNNNQSSFLSAMFNCFIPQHLGLGMDPSTRRKIWDLISEAGKDRAVILTTHSMEEAEALCNKIAIMVNGRIKCLGSTQHLKQKFLGGYTLTISCNINSSNAAIDETQTYILENVVPGARLSERHARYLKFDVPSFENGVTSLGMLFGMMQQLIENPNSIVISYSISQCTLEQIFINLVRAEGEESSQHSRL